jgi:hypothetical protein
MAILMLTASIDIAIPMFGNLWFLARKKRKLKNGVIPGKQTLSFFLAHIIKSQSPQ